MTSRRWIVRGDERDLAEIVAKLAPGDDGAIAEGRVFVGRSRARDPQGKPAVGEEIVVHEPRATSADVVTILATSNGVVAAYKPAAIASVPDHRGAKGTLVDDVARLVGASVDELHVTSRLDVGVSGVVLFATTAEARERLARARDEGRYRREYVAIARRAPEATTFTWDAPIGRANDPRLRATNGRDAKPAFTDGTVIARADGGHALLLLAPRTGRTHQLRVHASAAGCPLVGDPSYGGEARIVLASGAVRRPTRIALHALRVSIPDANGGVFRVDAPPRDDLRAIWEWLDGPSEVWETLVPP